MHPNGAVGNRGLTEAVARVCCRQLLRAASVCVPSTRAPLGLARLFHSTPFVRAAAGAGQQLTYKDFPVGVCHDKGVVL